MPLGTNHTTLTQVTNSSRTRSNSAFVRELWTDEIIAAYKSNLVMPQLVVTMPFVGKKGDTVHVPNPTRADASAKAAETQVTLIANNEGKKQYIIDQHWEYSRLIEDIVSVQADDTVRQFYTDDAGYALARRVDTHLHAEGAKLNGAGEDNANPTVESSGYDGAVVGGDSSGALVGWNSATSGNGSALTDAALRQMLRKLDDSDVPGRQRVLVIPPVEKANLLGLARFTEQAFVGETGAGNSIRNGLVGNLYGTDVYVSTNCASVDSADETTYRVALLFQKESFVFIEQMRPRVQTQYKQEWLGDLFTADVIYGRGVLRPEAGIAIVVPA